MSLARHRLRLMNLWCRVRFMTLARWKLRKLTKLSKKDPSNSVNAPNTSTQDNLDSIEVHKSRSKIGTWGSSLVRLLRSSSLRRRTPNKAHMITLNTTKRVWSLPWQHLKQVWVLWVIRNNVIGICCLLKLKRALHPMVKLDQEQQSKTPTYYLCHKTLVVALILIVRYNSVGLTQVLETVR